MELSLRAAAADSLEAMVYPNGIFLAERLFAEFKTLENLTFLANAHLRAGDASTAHALTHAFYPFHDTLPAHSGSPAPTPATGPAGRRGLPRNIPPTEPLWNCAYTYAVACCRTQRWQDAEAALLCLQRQGPGGANVAYWLGEAGSRLGRPEAGDYYVESVRQNPTMFCSLDAAARAKPSACTNPYSALLETPSQASAAATAAGGAPRPGTSTAVGASSKAVGLPLRHVDPRASVASSGFTQTSAANASRGDLDMYRLLHAHADAVLKLWSYDTAGCLGALNQHPALQRPTGFTAETRGLACFHAGETALAAKAFQAMRDIEPWSLNRESMVEYSTTLWHLKREAALGALAQRLVTLHPQSAVTMCVVGNCYSAARNPQSAYAMFERASQVAPHFAYAHTLRGHEALAMDRKKDAEAHFREAIHCDARHYSAYAGLGELYFRQDDAVNARNNLRRAMTINELPSIVNRLAATHSMQHATEADLRIALGLYDRVLSRGPNVGAMMHRASVLLKLDRVDEALHGVEEALDLKPDEAGIHQIFGHCLARLGHTTRAVAAYRRCVELDPRRYQAVKGCLDRLGAGEVH
jgi:tetratricopeptide (TPR) repeat protein